MDHPGITGICSSQSDSPWNVSSFLSPGREAVAVAVAVTAAASVAVSKGNLTQKPSDGIWFHFFSPCPSNILSTKFC